MGEELEQRAREILAEATGLALCDLRAERDDQRVLQGSAIRAMLAFRSESITPSPSITGLVEALKAIRRREVQMLHAAFSTRSWHDAISAGDQLRDKIDAAILEQARSLPVDGGWRPSREALIELIRDQMLSTDYPVSDFETAFADAILALKTTQDEGEPPDFNRDCFPDEGNGRFSGDRSGYVDAAPPPPELDQ